MADQQHDEGARGLKSGHRDFVAIGLTGGIGAGKSTALSMFADLGAMTVSADALVHDLYGRPEFVAQLVERFGPDVSNPEGGVDRRALACVAKDQPEALEWLEQLTHPLVKADMARVIMEAPPGSVVVCEVPLLLEAGFADLFDLLVTVEAGRDNRLIRSADRFDADVFDKFEGLQASTAERVAVSDVVLVNDGSPEQLRNLVGEVLERARAMLKAGA